VKEILVPRFYPSAWKEKKRTSNSRGKRDKMVGFDVEF